MISHNYSQKSIEILCPISYVYYSWKPYIHTYIHITIHNINIYIYIYIHTHCISYLFPWNPHRCSARFAQPAASRPSAERRFRQRRKRCKRRTEMAGRGTPRRVERHGNFDGQNMDWYGLRQKHGQKHGLTWFNQQELVKVTESAMIFLGLG